MKIFNKTLVIAMALPLVLGSMSAFAGQDNQQHNGGMNKGHHGGKIFSQLDLTATQKQEIKTLRQANRSEHKAQRVDNYKVMQVERQQLEKLVLASNFDESAVRAVAEKMSQQQVERRVKMLEQRHEMLNILTPEQKQKYADLKQQQSEKHLMRLEAKKYH
ncbi:Spy/CpxP family protein refolding chaperone [Photobacterium carnosum]|uniref:Spy/CpxP family protein refolding chaperone n=1 Tax=Photobacterium carnosum TaxID=2023717 RepID=UPI001C91C535|nr:Spy/CpxP family protein refolding chaperone [Photobacterium carnosum]MBY3788315.1 periplasmic heavy metal sensor [Photobacterium carnosum]MCD9529340.1 periplasmic heavy metal sensor [Photobacterium carnosum]MCD9533481.1 periplasmic heavy metal sensor [Photobacterium carnosum]MCF2153683.1 periplasmic heavy metal sensor [Photobacterium carnosum]MCF2215445.1 periplasmic heavy metal sensor [Photobacterium carnosum]